MATKSKAITISFSEASLGAAKLQVDKQSCIIRNVKLLGFVSKNGREYTPEAIKEAVPLYEGAPVNVDHTLDSKTPRSVHDRLGRLINVHFVEGEGLYGDLVYLEKHPMAERLVEAAERMPDAMGFSHSADGLVRKLKGGIEQVYKISKVNSVDLVADPATCNSLSESTMADKEDTTHVDIVKGDHPVKEASMCEVCKKVKEALNDKDTDDVAKMGKIKEAYDVKEGEPKPPVDPSKDSMGPGKKTSESEDADADDKPKDKDPEEKKESVEVTRLKLIGELKELCEQVKVKADSQMISDLSLLPKDAAVRQITRIALSEAVSTPKTSIPVPAKQESKIPEKGLADWLKN